MSRAVFLSLCLTASLTLPALAQQPSSPSPGPERAPQQKPADNDQDIVRITTNLVQVDAVVTKDGKQATDLKAEDFEIYEDGRPQSITNFSYISNVPGIASSTTAAARPPARMDTTAPVIPAVPRPYEAHRTIALVVDDLGISLESLVQARQQLRKFIDEQLEPNDLVAIIRTGGDVGALQQFTTDKRLLHNAIDHLRWNQCSRTGLYVFTPLGSEDTAGSQCGGQSGSLQTLRVLRFIVQGMRDLPGRKSLMIFSDSLPIEEQDPSLHRPTQTAADTSAADNASDAGLGNSTNYLTQLQKVAELAIRGSVVIYAVDTRGLQYTGLTAADKVPPSRNPGGQAMAIMTSRSDALTAGREGADLIARETGGFLIHNSNDFGIKRVVDDQRGYYLVGYRPTDESFNRHFHHIKIKVKRGGFVVRTRAGFYGVSEEGGRAKELTPTDQMNKALISPFGSKDIDVRLTTLFVDTPGLGSHVRALLHIGAHDLTFSDEADGWHVAKADLGFIVFGENGTVVRQEIQTGTFRLRGQTYDRALRNGIVRALDIPLKRPGVFQFRVAVRDISSSRIGAAGQFIQVPNLRNERLALSGLVLWASTGSVQQGAPNVPPAGSDSSASSNPGLQADDNNVTSGPAVRKFRPGANAAFAYSIYNALLDPSTHLAQLTAQVRVFRDGKVVYTGNPQKIDAAGQSDLKRIVSTGWLQLGSEFEAGDYVVQIIVTDQLARETQRTATQWVDFEVVK
jgi:VWFA-related protein